MYRLKGWADRLSRMSNEELLREQRMLERSRKFIFEKDEKILTIKHILAPKVSIEDLAMNRAGGLLRVFPDLRC